MFQNRPIPARPSGAVRETVEPSLSASSPRVDSGTPIRCRKCRVVVYRGGWLGTLLYCLAMDLVNAPMKCPRCGARDSLTAKELDG
jgi:phage FluMu protein Com